MAKPPRGASESEKDWYLREWMAHRGKIQAAIARDLGWERGRVSKVYNGRQPYRRADVVELAAWLGIEPYELLMSPRDAMALRNLRITAAQIVAEGDQAPFDNGSAPEKGRRRA